MAAAPIPRAGIVSDVPLPKTGSKALHSHVERLMQFVNNNALLAVIMLLLSLVGAFIWISTWNAGRRLSLHIMDTLALRDPTLAIPEGDPRRKTPVTMDILFAMTAAGAVLLGMARGAADGIISSYHHVFPVTAMFLIAVIPTFRDRNFSKIPYIVMLGLYFRLLSEQGIAPLLYWSVPPLAALAALAASFFPRSVTVFTQARSAAVAAAVLGLGLAAGSFPRFAVPLLAAASALPVLHELFRVEKDKTSLWWLLWEMIRPGPDE